MEAGHTSQITSSRVYLVSGRVEIRDAKNPRKVTKADFKDVHVTGETPDQRIANFDYSKCFPWEARKAVRQMVADGRVRVLEMRVDRECGLSKAHPVDGLQNAPVSYMDEVI